MCEACLIDDLSHRGLLRGAGVAGLALSLGSMARPGSALAAEPVPPDAIAAAEPEEVAPGVFFLMGETRYFRDGTRQGAAGTVGSLMCNNGWVVFDDHVLLIDANVPGRADALLAAVRRTTDKPVRTLFNTHHHGDHVYGNRVLAERTGAAVVAHAGMAEELRRHETGAFCGGPGRWEQVARFRPDVAAAPVMAPTRTFERSMTFDDGRGRRVELFHPGLGHTRGDAVAWLPRERVLFTGDLVTNGPFNIVRDSEMAPWLGALTALQALGPAVVCPGHGARGDASLLADQRVAAATRQASARVARPSAPTIGASAPSCPHAASSSAPRSAAMSSLSRQPAQ
jgi:cyclase